MNETERPASPDRPPADAQPPRQAPAIPSGQLFHGASEVLIEHNGAIYRLRQTSLGKLILTK